MVGLCDTAITHKTSYVKLSRDTDVAANDDGSSSVNPAPQALWCGGPWRNATEASVWCTGQWGNTGFTVKTVDTMMDQPRTNSGCASRAHVLRPARAFSGCPARDDALMRTCGGCNAAAAVGGMRQKVSYGSAAIDAQWLELALHGVPGGHGGGIMYADSRPGSSVRTVPSNIGPPAVAAIAAIRSMILWVECTETVEQKLPQRLLAKQPARRWAFPKI